MNTNQSNDSFQSLRVSCSKAKTRLLSLAFLLCLSGSAWAHPLPFDLALPDILLFKGSIAAESNRNSLGDAAIHQTPIGPPFVESRIGARTPVNGFRGHPRMVRGHLRDILDSQRPSALPARADTWRRQRDASRC